MAVSVDVKALLAAGLHFGHKTSRWHPKMAPYIHSKRQDSHIIDLIKTEEGLEKALAFISETVASGKQILFVGTKRQAKDAMKEVAVESGQSYVTERWVGGMLTNVGTMTAQIKKLKNLEKKMASGELAKRYNKLEVQRFQEEIDALNTKYSGVKDLNGKPGAIFVVDVNAEQNAINEAKRLSIPVIALTDTNANPSNIDYVIPGNDDAIKGVQLILDYAKQAVQEGMANRKVVKEEK